MYSENPYMTNEQYPRFSAEIIALYRRIELTEDPDERGELVLQLARQFSEEHDATDEGFSEGFHSVVDSYNQKFLEYSQAGLRLGRVLLHVLDQYADHLSAESPEVTDHSVN